MYYVQRSPQIANTLKVHCTELSAHCQSKFNVVQKDVDLSHDSHNYVCDYLIILINIVYNSTYHIKATCCHAPIIAMATSLKA